MFGKLLGAIVGLMLGLLVQGWLAAIIFAAIGAFLGHRYDELHQPPELDGEPDLRPPLSEVNAPPPVTVRAMPAQTRAEIDAQARAHFARHVCALFAEVARADGEIVRDEVRVVRAFFEEELKFSTRELELVRASLKAALAEPVELKVALEACTRELRASERLLLLDALYELALADGELRRSERDRIKTIAQGLKIPAEDLRAVAALHFGDDRAHCERLGLPPEASDDEIKLAYRRLAAAHHPDKVAHLGPGAQERASRTFRELNEAYEELRRTRGF